MNDIELKSKVCSEILKDFDIMTHIGNGQNKKWSLGMYCTFNILSQM